MKMLIMTLLILSSCRSWYPRPTIEPLERCTYSNQFNKCRCIMFDLYNWKRIGDGYDRESDYCDDLTGFHAKDWAIEITPWVRENIRYYEQARRSR